MKNNTLIVLVGPTAIGKTGLAIEIAKYLETEIISCDSRQIYRELKIGTARPTEKQLEEIHHHFIACCSITDYFNASMFELAVLEVLGKLFLKHKTVVMVGGSGLYVDAVCNGIDDLPTIDPEIRNQVLNRFANEGIDALKNELQKIDPAYYQTADIQNPKRIFKALEIYYMTGKPYSSFLTKTKKERDFNIVKIGLNKDRQELYSIIDQRVDEMIANGLIEEAMHLQNFQHLNALNTVGYKELFNFLSGDISKEEAIRQIKRNTRHYAKRQLTWFSRYNDINWFNPTEKGKIYKFINNII